MLFCDANETIQHLFIACPFACLIWRLVHLIFNISPPTNIVNMFGNWLNGIDKKIKAQILVGVCALLWAMWHVRNDYDFNKTGAPSFVLCFGREASGHGYCLQPFGNGYTRFVQPVRLVA